MRFLRHSIDSSDFAMAPIKRKSYTSEYKLTVVNYAKMHGNRQAEREFGVSEKNVLGFKL